MSTGTPHGELQICVVELGGQRFGLRLDAVIEVVPMASVFRPPATPSILEGFLNLRGRALPVVRTAPLLGLAQDRLGLQTSLVIVRVTGMPMALLVNRVHGIVAADPAVMVPIAESDSFNACVDGHLRAGDHAVHLLSLDRLLLEKEQQMLAEFQATETDRLRQLVEVLS